MYGVFGVSLKDARRLAEKNTHAFENGIALNVQEYRAKVDKRTLKIFNEMPIRLLSPVYSNYTEAAQYKDMCRNAEGYDKLVIRKRKQQLDGDGKVVLTKKTKKAIMYWEDASGPEQFNYDS